MSPYIILIAAMAFIVTVGALHVDQVQNPPTQLKTSEQTSPLATPNVQRISKQKPTHEAATTPITAQIQTTTSTAIPNPQTSASPTTVTTSLIPTPLASIGLPPSPSQTQMQYPSPTATILKTTPHIYYTSSHWKAKYYYCDTDSDWKELSDTYRKSYQDQQSLLNAFPNRLLHEPCKE